MKSPQSCSSHKCRCSLSPTTGSTGCKRRDLCGEDSSAVDTTLPVSSSMFDAFCSPTGSFSDVIEPLPPPLLLLPWVRPVPDTGTQPQPTAGTPQLCSSPAQTSTYPATLPLGLGALLLRYPASLVPTTY